MKKKIFITGISSLIIKDLCSLINLSEYEIIGLTRNSSLFSIKNSTIINGDIHDTNTFSSYLENCEMIIHAAATTHSFSKKNYYQTNFEATKELVDKAKSKNVKKFIFISSNTASENSGAYGRSKLLAEKYIIENFDNWLIIRLSEVYGKQHKNGIDKLIQNGIHKSIVFCPKGMSYKFSPIHIKDATKLIFNTIFKTHHYNKIKIINGREKYTFREILELIKKYKKLNIIHLNKRIMFIILKIATLLPFYIGIIPDQIERLYGFKTYEKVDLDLFSLETYIKNTITNKQKNAL